MRILPERWTIDRWPMRTIVSFYLMVSGALAAFAVVIAGLMVQSVQTMTGVAVVRVFSTVTLRPDTLPRAALAPFLAGSAAVAVFFLAAVALMWTPWRWNWLPALVAGVAAGAAWWFLAWACVAPPNHPTLLAATGLFVLTAVVTVGVLAAIVRRAPATAGSGAASGLVASAEDRSTT